MADSRQVSAHRAMRRDEDRAFWRALPWAVLSWLLALWAVGYVLATPRQESAEPTPVEARIVELPPSPPAARAENTPPPPPKQALPPPPVPQPQLAPAAPPPPQAKAAPETPAPPTPAPPPPAPTAVAVKAVAGVDTHGVQVISQVQPDLPDDLAQAAAGQTVTAHFQVAADGSFSVTLAAPSSNPAVNRSVLATLRTWKFSPALQAGKPVAATLDVSLPF